MYIHDKKGLDLSDASLFVIFLERHPDKGGSDEDFKRLYAAYETIGNAIDENNTDIVLDEEETEAWRCFREENWENVNSTSVTVKIKASEGNQWGRSTQRENG